MSMLNIDRRLQDSFYCYKMPKLVTKVVGTRDNIKTVLVNISSIANALNRPVTYITTFFRYALGVQVQMNTEENLYILNGDHDCERLQNLLDDFIQRFVLCSRCFLPETRLSCRQRNDGELHQLCAACGYRHIIDIASHKLATYIANSLSNQKSEDKLKVKNTARTSIADQESSRKSPIQQEENSNNALIKHVAEDDNDKPPERQIDFSCKTNSGTGKTVQKESNDDKIEYNGEIVDIDDI